MKFKSKTFTLELFELVELSGADLKVYILIKNAGRSVTAKELEQTIGWLPGCGLVQSCLSYLTSNHWIERTRNGRYRLRLFPYNGQRLQTGARQAHKSRVTTK